METTKLGQKEEQFGNCCLCNDLVTHSVMILNWCPIILILIFFAVQSPREQKIKLRSNIMNNKSTQMSKQIIPLILLVFVLLLSACQALEPSQAAQADSSADAEQQSAEVQSVEEAAEAPEEEAVQTESEEEAAEQESEESEAETVEQEAAESEAEAEEEASDEPQLATAKASSQLTNQPGRAIVSARGNHFIVDSVPPIEGPNEELNPLDMILGSLATCGLFIAERVAMEEAIPLEDVLVAVEADLDASGVAGSGADPRLQKMRVHLDLPGASEEQAAQIVENFTARCPIYTTLSRATDLEITVGDEVPSAATEGLNTAKVSSQLSNQPGRAIVSARGNHFVIDSVPPIEGPNEERNPLDLLLGSLSTCGTFIFERAAQEMDVPLTGVTTTVEGDLDPRGLAVMGASDPRIQAFRVMIEAEGIDDAQAEAITAEYQQRCPIYTTLERAAPIDITVTTTN
jgi:uncharacterized OsmC-like protein